MKLEPTYESIALYFEIVAGLQIQPEPFRHVNVSGRSQARVRHDGSRLAHNVVDATGRNAQVFRKAVL